MIEQNDIVDMTSLEIHLVDETPILSILHQ